MDDDIDNEFPTRQKLIAEMVANGTLLPPLSDRQKTWMGQRLTTANWTGWTYDECRWSAQQEELRHRNSAVTEADPTKIITARLRKEI